MQTKLNVRLISHTPKPELLASVAGHRCYSPLNTLDLLHSAQEVNAAAYVDKVVGMGHVTIIEHVTFTFAVEGVSRSLLAQCTRHRIGVSFSVQSQRYCGETAAQNENGVFDYIVPPRIEALGPSYMQAYHLQMKQIQEWYDTWVHALGGDRDAFEDARFVLPNAVETKFIMTMNARELLHFFTLRCCERAQWEIRAMADQMLKQVKAIAPAFFKKAGPACLRGPCPEGKLSCGQAKKIREKYLFSRKEKHNVS